MKLSKNIILLAAAAFVLAACSKSGAGKGDATVSFEKTSYTFSENAGAVTVPLVFTGEPAEYPIVLNIGASVEGEFQIDEVVHFVQQIGSLKYNGKGELAVEMEIIDNFNPNNDVVLSLDIVSAEGAEIVGGHTEITIEDNDESLFTSLQGAWAFYANQNNETPVYFGVGIDAGETEAEQAENERIQRLRVLGFGNYFYTDGGEPFQWFLDIVTDEITGEQSLKTVSGIPLVSDTGKTLEVDGGDATGEYSNARIDMWSALVSSPLDANPTFEITATLSEDGSTITFDPDWTFLPYFWLKDDTGQLAPYAALWGQFYDCYMKRR